MADGLLMTEGLLFSFHSTVLGFRVRILQLITVIPKFCEEAQNYKIGISVTLFWKISTRTGFFFRRKWEVAIIIISSVLVSMNINTNLFSFL